MTSVKIKFRASTIDGEKGRIFYQIIHNRVIRMQKTNYRLYANEWNNHLSEIVFSLSNEERIHDLSDIKDNIKLDIKLLYKIITTLEQTSRYTIDDIINEFLVKKSESYLFPFMENVIINLKTLGKIRTSETYATTLRSFKRFRKNKDLALDNINSDIITTYESYLHSNGITPNSSSFYMRNLRAVYNRAVDKGLTTQKHPFKHVYTGIDKTVKRAIPLKAIKHLKDMELSNTPTLDFARDMFLFSFYTRGMSFVDMAYLQKKDLKNGILSYRRRKTGQLLFIKWEKCMQKIVEKHKVRNSEYLLPIITPNNNLDLRKQYIYKGQHVNYSLKKISKRMRLPVMLTMYVARHTWASIAKSINIPISVISESMGHESETTTQIYLSSLDNKIIDQANKLVLNLL